MSFADKVEEQTKDLDFDNKKYAVTLKTSMGNIRLDLYPEVAPEHCKNIIGLSRAGFYDGLIFHRIIAGFVIQGGCPEGSGMGGPGFNVKAEFNDKKHVLGTLSMARAQDPNSAGSQFFVCLGDVPHLNGQYTVFGQADEASLPVVEKIGAVKTGAGDRPVEDIVIESATVEVS